MKTANGVYNVTTMNRRPLYLIGAWTTPEARLPQPDYALAGRESPFQTLYAFNAPHGVASWARRHGCTPGLLGACVLSLSDAAVIRTDSLALRAFARPGDLPLRGALGGLSTDGPVRLGATLRARCSAPLRLSGAYYHHRWNAHESKAPVPAETVTAYVLAGRRLAVAINEFAPDCVVLPLRGAVPIWRVIEPWVSGTPALRFPATSSFIFLGEGRSLHAIIEPMAERVFNEGFRRVAYVDEVVSGNMAQKHARILCAAAVRHGGTVGVFALSDADGTKERPAHIQAIRVATARPGFANSIVKVPRLLGEDDRRYSGLHYLEERGGPVCVPWDDEAGDEPFGKRQIDRAVRELLTEEGRTA